MIRRTCFTVGVAALSSLGVFLPSTVLAQHGPGRHGPDSGPAYDITSEGTVAGTVAAVKTSSSMLFRLLQIHTFGVGHKRAQEKRVLLKTDAGTVPIHLGPTAFLTDQNVEIKKGDALEVTGSWVTIGQSQVVLAREIRKADRTWTLRDATGQQLWSPVPAEARGFWSKKKVLLTVVVVKVVALATVLRH